jgi:hypothetical protein
MFAMPPKFPNAGLSRKREAETPLTVMERAVAKKKKYHGRRLEAKMRADAGQAALDHGEMPAPIDLQKAARYLGLEKADMTVFSCVFRPRLNSSVAVWRHAMSFRDGDKWIANFRVVYEMGRNRFNIQRKGCQTTQAT